MLSGVNEEDSASKQLIRAYKNGYNLADGDLAYVIFELDVCKVCNYRRNLQLVCENAQGSDTKLLFCDRVPSCKLGYDRRSCVFLRVNDGQMQIGEW